MQIWLFEVVFFRVDEEVAFNGSLISLYTVRYIYSFLQMDVAL